MSLDVCATCKWWAQGPNSLTTCCDNKRVPVLYAPADFGCVRHEPVDDGSEQDALEAA